MKFTKMHGIGNDYVYINCFEESVENPQELAVRLSDRHFSIGGDGIVLIQPSTKADCFMAMYNADGSQSEMCGNAIRCVAKYMYEYGLTKKKNIEIDTLCGIKYLELKVKESKVISVLVDMGEPILEAKQIPVESQKAPVIDEKIEALDRTFAMTCVSMGNPHAVIFVEDVEHFPLETYGPVLECHKAFPRKANIEFVEIVDENTVKMRVWERGSGETLACGTGACATGVACVLNGRTKEKLVVQLLGGDLHIHWDKDSGHVFMEGPATVVFDGNITI